MSDDPHAPTLPPVTVAVTKAALPEDLSVPRMVALARDLAMDMFERPVLLKKHGITPEQFATLEAVPYFKTVVAAMAEEWNAPKNAQQRLAVQTAVGLEEVLPDVIARAKVKNENLQGVAQLVKVLAEIAGAVGQPKTQSGAPGEKFKITIDLGGDTVTYDKTKSITIETGAPEAGPVSVQPLTEGIGALLSLQPKPDPA